MVEYRRPALGARALVLIAASVALLAACFVGSASAGVAQLDRSYGVDGVVDVDLPDPSPFVGAYPGAGLQVIQMQATRGGAVYVLGKTSVCREGRCPQSSVVYRYGPSGSLDLSFGGPGGFFDVPRGSQDATLAVDSAGRPLLTQIVDGSRILVRRLTTEGLLDLSFGNAGVAEFRCACADSYPNWARVAPGRRGTGTVVITADLPQPGRYSSSERAGTIFRLFRLRADGSVNRSFGRNGLAAFTMRGVTGGGVTTPTPGGGLYLAGRECCDSEIPAFLARVSARGRLDRRFLATSRRSLGVLRRLPSLSRWIAAVQVRRRGKIDLIGSTGQRQGFVLRLRPDGRRLRQYAKGGLRPLPLPVQDAAPGAEGSTVAITHYRYGIGRRLFRLLPGGRLDRAFGRPGTTVTERLSGAGFSLAALSGRRVALFTVGAHVCRGHCPPTPAIARYLEPRRRG